MRILVVPFLFIQRLHLKFGAGEARGDVLGAVPIEADGFDEEDLSYRYLISHSGY